MSDVVDVLTCRRDGIRATDARPHVRDPRTLNTPGSTEPEPPSARPLRRELTFFDATMLVVSSVIGVGIFLTPGTIADILPAPGLILAAWIVGGMLSLAGALANAELSAMYPHAGGDYVYLREAYHPVAGFLVGWLSFFVIYAGTVATLAAGFAEGLGHFVPLGMPTARLLAAVLITVATSWINYVGVRTGARVNNVTGAIKIVALVGLVVVGPLLGAGSLAHLTPLLPDLSGGAGEPLRLRALAGAVQLPGLERHRVRGAARSTIRDAPSHARCSPGWPCARRSIWS